MFNTIGSTLTTFGGGVPVWKEVFAKMTSGAKLGVVPAIGSVLPAGTPVVVDKVGGTAMPIAFYKAAAAVVATPASPAVKGVYALELEQNAANTDTIAIGGVTFEFVTTPASGKVTIGADAGATATALQVLIAANTTLNAVYDTAVAGDTILFTQKVGGTGAQPAIVVTQASAGTGLEAYISTITVGSAAVAAVTATEIVIVAKDNYEAPIVGDKIKVLSTGVELTVSDVGDVTNDTITLTVSTITAGIPKDAILYLSEHATVDIDVANLAGLTLFDVYAETGTTAATVAIVASGTVYADRVPFVPQEVKSYIPNIIFEKGI